MNRCLRAIFLVLLCPQILLAGGLLSIDSLVPPAIAAGPVPAHGVGLSAFAKTPFTQPPQASVKGIPPVNGLIAREHLVALSENIGAREAGTPQEAEAAAYIQSAFEELGYTVEMQPFSFMIEDDDDEASYNSANVIAVKPGSSSWEIIVGAHYDSVEVGTGADDNASGVGVMLEVAEKVVDIPTPYTIRFVAFGAEEVDLDGSSFYVDQMSASDVENTVGMINLDGLIVGDIAYVYGGDGPADSLDDWILERAQDTGFDLETVVIEELDFPDGTPCECADYGPFQAAGIPIAFFETTNWNLGEQDGKLRVSPEFGEKGVIEHTEYDTIDYIDSTFPGRAEQHLDLFVTLLYDTLTQFE